MSEGTRPGGLDGATVDLRRYELLRAHILARDEVERVTGRGAQRIRRRPGAPPVADP